MFKVGDRVKGSSMLGDAAKVFGLSGSVVHISGVRVGVNWDEDIDGHTCGQRYKPGFGWYVNNTDLRKAIVFKGNK